LPADPRQYHPAVRAALAALCGGTCYWPGCPEPVIRFVDGAPVSNLQIAHIRAAEPGGPRYLPGMTAEERKAFSNLILLCHPHHTTVDKRRPQDFPAETLQKWKAAREKDHEAALSRLREVTPEGLQRALAAILADRDKRLHNLLERLERSDTEAAQLLQSLIDEVADLRRSRYVDGGATEGFTSAANRLYQVFSSGLVEQFIRAANRLPDR
jgi:hypothetical protein